ncbi:MAG: nucleoside kinase [Clostridia bacterium]|nr:nucleoside kinase [Clostridia bacterium]
MAEMDLHIINDMLRTDLNETIANAERYYHEEMEEVAAAVAGNPDIRVILLAGPSSSGKTTSANILKDRIIEKGRHCQVVSLDDFYRNRDEDYPINEDGTYDYENVTALRIDRVVECLQRIIDRQDCPLPHYEFKTALRHENAEILKAHDDHVVIVEGLHALNPVFSDPLPKANIYKVFVSVSTNINVEGKRIISGRKIRFLRRLTRDFLYRGASVDHTLEMWPNVLLGEDKYLYPYKALADCSINTFHMYEIGAILPFTELMLQKQPPQQESDFLSLVLSAARRFEPIPEEKIPATSLLREFIPGGIYEHLY